VESDAVAVTAQQQSGAATVKQWPAENKHSSIIIVT
jgi:hypothetical protein